MPDVVSDVVINYKSVGLDQVGRDIKQASVALDGLVVAETSAERATTSLENRFKSLERQFGTTSGNADRYAKVQDTINKAVAQNPELQGRGAELLAQAAEKYGQVGNAVRTTGSAMEQAGAKTKLASYEMLNFSRQLQDVGVSLVGGQSPFMVLAQQLPQIADIAKTSGVSIGGMFRQAAEGVISSLTPMRLAVTVVGALGAATAYLVQQRQELQKSADLALMGPGRQTGTTVGDINRFTAQNVSPSTLSASQARATAEELTKGGDIVISKLHDMDVAIAGFAQLTKKSMEEARKAMVAFANDPQAAMDELRKHVGEFSLGTRRAVAAAIEAGDKTKAWQLVMDGMSETTRNAADEIGFLQKMWNNLRIPEFVTPKGPEEQLKAAQARLSTLQASPAMGGFGEENIRKATAEVERLQAAIDKTNADRITEQFNRSQVAIHQATAGIERMRPVLEAVGGAQRMAAQYAVDYANALEKSKDAAVATAIAAANLANTQAQAAAAAKETLFNLQAQAAAAAAVTDREKIAAEAEITRNKLIHDGVDAYTAQAVTAQQLANAQGAANAGVERQIRTLQDAKALIEARLKGTEAAVLAEQAYQKAIDAGASAMKATALAAAVRANEAAKAAEAEERASASKRASDTRDLEAAAENARQRRAAAIATDDAAIAANRLATETWRAELAARTFGQDMSGISRWIADQTYVATSFASRAAGEPGTFVGSAGSPSGSSVSLNPFVSPYGYSGGQDISQDTAFADRVAKAGAGGIQAALNLAMATGARQPTYAYDPNAPGSRGAMVQYGVQESEIISQVDSLYQTLNQGADKATQMANMQKEMAWLQGRPVSIEQQRQIATLRQSIEQLTQSTDQLNQTNQDLLSPYYTQDPRTSHIGFRSQGMATGGWVDVPGGVSANDNIVASIPVASGERIYVDPQPTRRGTGSGSSYTINISSPVMIAGNPDKDEIGRTMFQNNQLMARQLRSAMK